MNSSKRESVKSVLFKISDISFLSNLSITSVHIPEYEAEEEDEEEEEEEQVLRTSSNCHSYRK